MQAAALPLAALTAWQALVDHAGLAAGEQVLVHGGAGGVGVYAVQLAAGLGAHVTANDVSSQAEFVRQPGAERFIDITTEAFDQTLPGLDVVLDTVGGATLQRSYAVLRAGGRLVTLGAPPPPDLAEKYGVQAVFFIVRPDRSNSNISRKWSTTATSRRWSARPSRCTTGDARGGRRRGSPRPRRWSARGPVRPGTPRSWRVAVTVELGKRT